MRTVRLNEIYENHKDRVEFFLIYIHEAHPSNGWQTPQNLYDDVVFQEPKTEDERAEIAGACRLQLDIKLPTLLDDMDNSTEGHYVSEPIRLFVVDPDGRITFNGAQGPFGFDLEKWDQAIRDVLKPAEQAAE